MFGPEQFSDKEIKHMDPRNFLTVKQMAERHPFISQSSLRWYLFTEPPGFMACVRRLGRKIVLDEAAFLNWVDSQKPA